MDSEGFSDTNDTPAPDAPMAPPSPPAPASMQSAPTEQVPQIAPAQMAPAQMAPAQVAPAPAAAPMASNVPIGQSVVMPQVAAPAKRTPWKGIAAGVAILGLGAAAVVGWMGKASAEDDVQAGKEVATVLTKEADDLRSQLDAANQATADATAELDSATAQVADPEGQTGDLESQVSDLESQIADKDAEIAALEEANNNNNNASDPTINDLVLSQQEYDLAQSVAPLPLPALAQAQQLGVDICSSDSIAGVGLAVQDHLGDFPEGSSIDDIAQSAGAIAGLMCQDKLLDLAG